ncbi:unnamed protein product [Rotaria sordida]|uniref:Calpain catalytic domain-containing protein n=3 Tax=Rotaria sordida TaxID=392033 RepID=A0A818R8I1_9BILA|nr:unnamed protein product [Rotaria sordida]
MQHYSAVTKLVHYTSKFTFNSDKQPSRQYSSVRNQRLSSSSDSTDRSKILAMSSVVSSKMIGDNRLLNRRRSRINDTKRFRLTPIWSEWNEAEINAESWDAGNIKKKDLIVVRARSDTKTNIPMGAHNFEDPEGKVELPPSLKVEHWKRPIEFLTADKSPVIVDPDLGTQSFDLVTPNEHLHHSETMRKIISELTALWDICRKERKNINTTAHNINEVNIADRTWHPWEHIYALNKVSKQPFITPYNPSGKYIVRLFFLGTWRKIIIDDTIPFDSENRCLLPQTSLSYELWPMLLSKALLKIISLDFNTLNDFPESNEVSVIHSLTGWIPEPIPLKYTHAEQVWDFLRYDRSNQYVSENQNGSSFGPIPLFKWPDAKVTLHEERILVDGTDSSDHFDDKKSEDKNSKKRGSTFSLVIPKDPTVMKSINNKENRTISSPNLNTSKETKKLIGTGRGGPVDDSGSFVDDQMILEAPKLIVFATMSHLQLTRISSFSETADRSERLRRYNLNDTLSTSMLLTSIRDIPLEPPPPPEYVPPWKLIRPKKPIVLPHAEPITPHESKPERWIEITSPYINYPIGNVLNTKPTIRSHPIDSNVTTLNTSSRLNRSAKHLAIPDQSNIIEVDEDENIENGKLKSELNIEFVQCTTNIGSASPRKESNVTDTREKSDDSLRSTVNKTKCEMSIDRTKIPRKSVAIGTKISSDTISTKSKGGESEKITIPIDVQPLGNNNEQQNSPLTNVKPIKKSYTTPKIWMDFDDFCACFTSIIVFHNPRGYHYAHKHTEIKFVPYQQPVITSVREKKKESNHTITQIPNLQDDKPSLYLFIDSTRETLDKNIQLIISLTCLSRWYDTLPHELVGLNEKVSQKDIIPQTGSLIAELYSWKSLTMGQPILRLHTTATKAALLTLSPGRHVLKLTNTCPLACNVQILSDTNDFMLGDEDQLLNKITSMPGDADFIIRAEELFLALDDSIQNFHLIDQQENKLHDLFNLYCEHAPKSLDLTIQTCFNIFNQALYSTLRTVLAASGSTINVDTQFAWRCFTNDLSTPDILAAYEAKRLVVRSLSRHSARAAGSSSASTGTSTPSKRTIGGREKNVDDKPSLKQQFSLTNSSSTLDMQEESLSDLSTRELNVNEIVAITNIQKSIRGFLQRRITFARTSGTEKNLFIQQILQSNMSLLKADQNKSALLLFKNFISIKPELSQCFTFDNDDWNMITYRDYNGIYQEQPANNWFVLFREIFYINEESVIAAKFLSHLSNTLLHVINNDTYDEMPLIFNRLRPGMFTKNKNGYTFFAEGISLDQSIPSDRFRLRLITSYTQLPEIRTDQIISSFITKEIIDYYIPNKEQIICRYRIIISDNVNQTGLNYHLASIHFSTSKTDVLMRLTVLDNNEEIVSVEGKGCLVLPAILFMRMITNIVQPQPQPVLKSTPKTTGGSRKKDLNNTYQGNITDLTTMNSVRSDKDKIGNGMRTRSNSRTGLIIVDEEDKLHKYIIQVTLPHKSWPLTANQWQFVEQLKEQEKNELQVFNPQSSTPKTDRPINDSTSSKRTGQTNSNISTTSNRIKSSTVGSGRSSTTSLNRSKSLKENTEKTIDTSKPHWILRIISDADKVDELTIKKDTERNEELMNIKKAWATFQVGRAKKAMETRQKFLDSLQSKVDEVSLYETIDDATNISEIRTDEEVSTTINSSIIEQQQSVNKQTSTTKKSISSTKKESVKDEVSKQIELISPSLSSSSQIDEPLLDEPPASKPKIILPPLDVKPFLKQKLFSDEPIISDSLFEQEDLQRRQSNFIEHSKYVDEIRQIRQEDQNNRYKEKIRQLEEYFDLQAKTDQIRCTINEPREEFRQRFLEIERIRLQELAIQEEQLMNEEKAKLAAMIKPIKKKTSTGKKKKK